MDFKHKIGFRVKKVIKIVKLENSA